MDDKLEESIKTYIALKEPNYALLVTGEWGAGKTHKIKNILNDNMYYVSLFDIDSISSIYSSLFYSMHKKKDSAKKIFKKLTDFRVNLFGINFAIGELTSSLIDVVIKEEILKDKVIVFDDIERSRLDHEKIFGVISSCIEIKKCNVIIIMNDKAIEKKDYEKFLEKTVGITIAVEPSYHEAYDYFVAKLSNKEFFKQIKSFVILILLKSSCFSLRVLRRVLYEVDNIYKSIDINLVKEQSDSINHFLCMFIILSIEVKYGRLNEKNIINRPNNLYINHIIEHSIEEYKRYVDLYDIYESIFLFDNDFFNDTVIFDILFNGIFNRSNINESIKVYFDSLENIPPWKIIYEYHKYNDKQVKDAISNIFYSIGNGNSLDFGTTLHYFSSLLLVEKYNLLEFENDNIKDYCLKYIDNLFKNNKLPYLHTDYIYFNELFNESYGYRYRFDKNNIFLELRKYFHKKIIESNSKKDKEVSLEILNYIGSWPEKFRELVTNENISENKKNYYSVDILKHISPNLFVKALIDSIGNVDYNITLSSLMLRYKNGNLESVLQEEKDWLKNVINEFENYNSNGILKMRIDNIIKRLNAIINN